jgi:endonuclease-3 related protein
LRDIPHERLAELIRPAGFFNVKSTRLKNFIGWLFSAHGGSLEEMFLGDWIQLRAELLTVRGIGPETCDAILLYAGNKPSFVVDAYTKRLFFRLGLISAKASYDQLRELFMLNLPAHVGLFNEYHALIVEHCKECCRTRPLCGECALRFRCGYYQQDPTLTS